MAESGIPDRYGWRVAQGAAAGLFLSVARFPTGFSRIAPTERFLAERERWALWLPVVLGMGIGAYFALPAEPTPWIAPIMLGAACVSLAFTRGPQRPFLQAWGLISLVLIFLALGFGIAQLRTLSLAAPILERSLGPTEVRGRIVTVQPRERGERLVLETPEIRGLAAADTPARIRVTLATGAEGLYPGDWVRGRAKLSPPPEPAVPGAYDFARAAYFKQLGAVGFAYGRFELLPEDVVTRAMTDRGTDQMSRRWEIWWADLRHRLSERIVTALPGDPGAVAAALMTGERGRVPKVQLQALRDAGLAHLLAISGLHIGLVAAGLFFGLRGVLALIPGLALNYPIKKWAALVALPGAFAYLMLVGATIPAQRAFLMTGLMLLAVLLDRRALSMRLVAWAAMATLLLAPESLLSVSFQMSFAAVTVMIAAYEGRRGLFRHPGGDFWSLGSLWRYGLGVAVTSGLATVATAAFAVYHFNHLALYGVFANVLAVPITAFWIMPWALVAFLLMPFGLEAVPLWFMGLGIEGVIATATTVSAWPAAALKVSAMPVWGLLAASLGGLWLAIWTSRWRFLGSVPLIASILSIMFWTPPDVLVSADARLVAVRLDDGSLWRSNAAVNRFAADIWSRRAGVDPASKINHSLGKMPQCDPMGCILQINGARVALAWTAGAVAEDCPLVDLMISRVPVRRACRHPKQTIDRFDLWRKGAHAIWIGEGGIRVESVAETRGERPWVLIRGKP